MTSTSTAREPAASKAERTRRINVARNLDYLILGEIVFYYENPTVISSKVTKLLNWLRPQDKTVVHSVAKMTAEIIANEHTPGQVQRLMACLEPMIAWLKRHGCDDPSLFALTPR